MFSLTKRSHIFLIEIIFVFLIPALSNHWEGNRWLHHGYCRNLPHLYRRNRLHPKWQDPSTISSRTKTLHSDQLLWPSSTGNCWRSIKYPLPHNHFSGIRILIYIESLSCLKIFIYLFVSACIGVGGMSCRTPTTTNGAHTPRQWSGSLGRPEPGSEAGVRRSSRSWTWRRTVHQVGQMVPLNSWASSGCIGDLVYHKDD